MSKRYCYEPTSVHGKLSDVAFYFGLQTDVHASEPPYRRGKGLLFSRWETLDLATARFSETDGWTQSCGHEGNFIGVRRSYAWGARDYRVRFAPDSDPEDDGVWFGLWITDRSTDNHYLDRFAQVPTAGRQGCDESADLLNYENLRAWNQADRHSGMARKYQEADGRREQAELGTFLAGYHDRPAS